MNIHRNRNLTIKYDNKYDNKYEFLMANAALIIAETGSGKSTSMETLDPKSTLIINVAGKPLPFKGWKKLYTPFNSKDRTGNYAVTSVPREIVAVMGIADEYMPHINAIVIDDWVYASTFEYMNRSHEKTYDRFTDIAKGIYVTAVKPRDMRPDITVFYLTHPQSHENLDGDTKFKAKTVGKLVDSAIVIEGLFTVVLYGRAKRIAKETDYFFETQTDGQTPSKSPRGMFDSFRIPNDLELVRRAMIEYE